VCTIYCETGKRTLVLVDDLSYVSSHSIFFNSLKERGYTLDIQKSDEKVEFQKWGTFLYDNLILFSPNSRDYNFEADNSNKINSILEFIDAGGNVLLAGGSKYSPFVSSIAESVGVKFEDVGTTVVDHFNYDQSDFDGEHNLLVVDNFVNTEIIGKKSIAPVLYRGNSLSLVSDNRLVFPLLHAHYTSYLLSKSSVKIAEKKIVP